MRARHEGDGPAHRDHNDGDKVLLPPKPVARLLELLVIPSPEAHPIAYQLDP
jgi:hypothetical protein